MNEQQLRSAFGAVLDASTAPPPMDAEVALRRGRRARRRRQTTVGAGITVLAVVAIALASTLGPGLARDGWVDPAKPTVGPPTTMGPPPTVAQDSNVMPTLPGGARQSDRTASAGPRFDAAKRLLEEVVTLPPAGWTAVQGTESGLPRNYATERWHQANFRDRVGGVEVWDSDASTAVVSTGAGASGLGRLAAQITTPRHDLPAEPCALAGQSWRPAGTKQPECRIVTVGDRQAGVVTAPAGAAQRAGYRHPDGTVVLVEQLKKADGSGLPGLPSLPLTEQQLAEAACSDRLYATVQQ